MEIITTGSALSGSKVENEQTEKIRNTVCLLQSSLNSRCGNVCYSSILGQLTSHSFLHRLLVA